MLHRLLRASASASANTLSALSSAEAPNGKFLNTIRFGRARGERWEEGKGGSVLSSLFPLPGIPCALPFFPLSMPTTKKPFLSKQHERPLQRRESIIGSQYIMLIVVCLRYPLLSLPSQSLCVSLSTSLPIIFLTALSLSLLSPVCYIKQLDYEVEISIA